MSKRCIQCHAEISKTATVCPKCGTELTGDPQVEVSVPSKEPNSEKISSKLDITSLVGAISGALCSVTCISF